MINNKSICVHVEFNIKNTKYYPENERNAELECTTMIGTMHDLVFCVNADEKANVHENIFDIQRNVKDDTFEFLFEYKTSTKRVIVKYELYFSTKDSPEWKYLKNPCETSDCIISTFHQIKIVTRYILCINK